MCESDNLPRPDAPMFAAVQTGPACRAGLLKGLVRFSGGLKGVFRVRGRLLAEGA